MPLKTPDITPVGFASLAILFVTNMLVLFGLDIGAKRESALEVIINGGFVVAFLVHDAIIRHGRAQVAAATIVATAPLVAAEEANTLTPVP